MELLHLCSIFLLLMLFFQYSLVGVKPAEVDLKTNLHTHSLEYIVRIKIIILTRARICIHIGTKR